MVLTMGNRNTQNRYNRLNGLLYCGLWTVDCGLWIVDCRLSTFDHGPSTNSKIHIPCIGAQRQLAASFIGKVKLAILGFTLVKDRLHQVIGNQR